MDNRLEIQTVRGQRRGGDRLDHGCPEWIPKQWPLTENGVAEVHVKRKLTAILSADVVEYNRLMADDDLATVRILEMYRETMTNYVSHFHGRVVDSPGDNILAEFASVVDGLQCAVEIQRELAERNEALPEDRQMKFRIGVNTGDVIQEGGRIYGDGVNIAAQLESIANPGEICISGNVHSHVNNKLNAVIPHHGTHATEERVGDGGDTYQYDACRQLQVDDLAQDDRGEKQPQGIGHRTSDDEQH